MRRTRNKDGIRTFSKDVDLVDTKRKEIADQALIVFNRQGYNKTSMQDLAAATGMSIGGIYHYFGSKQDILVMIMSRIVASTDKRYKNVEARLADASATEVLKGYIDRFYKDVEKHFESTLFIYQEFLNLSPKWQQAIKANSISEMDTCAAILRRGAQNGEFKIADAQVMANSIITLAHMWVLRSRYIFNLCPMDDYIKIQIDMILKGIARNKAHKIT